ncbi:MAG: pantetheine-phosphate adenylyltransferase [Clostridiales bacterium]|nr:pantetheine-phosphate adenylyltransferase [Clostridiales bacterium]
MKRIAMIPGSFDPATLGHVDIIRRAAGAFDEVYAVVMVNAEKQNTGMFSPVQRRRILESACRDISNVQCLICEELAAEFADKLGVSYVVKGLRNGTDFDYEYTLAEIMHRFSPRLETVFLPARPALAHVSSTYARERLRYGADLTDVADPATAALMLEFLAEK